jgi:hypothetical protein
MGLAKLHSKWSISGKKYLVQGSKFEYKPIQSFFVVLMYIYKKGNADKNERAGD